LPALPSLPVPAVAGVDFGAGAVVPLPDWLFC
jgi:hypothetical protein